ncbi:MAG: hypothetical protein OQJ96_04930 [Flavobacteriales bacterium]|nr:hypothetical protein [Flavobacteriales bacterium]MCW8937169.1 hypothetical protein [Flavobacteriales bacterium]MCW8968679.1 hypothetical protein [Flavobacteriales bacterium]MCW8991504.1 hypothetical protein [Flavobacteriales bacterium]MCW9019624.1 hypothetical protein [Flavobacteriales bacterium]
MKIILLIILSSFTASNTYSQTDNFSEIDSLTKEIDSLRINGYLNKVEYPDMSSCGGYLQGYYLDTNLINITSIYSAEAGHISEDVYFKNGNAIKIVFKQHSAEWEKHSLNYPQENAAANYKNMTYTDTTYQIYLTAPPNMLKYSKSKLVNNKLDSVLLEQLISCYKSMILELNGDIKGAILELEQNSKNEIIILDD